MLNRILPLTAPLVFAQFSILCVAQAPLPTVTFAKVMNPAFAEEYQSQTLQTTAKFLAAGPTEGWLWGAIPEEVMRDKVAFRVVEQGASAVQVFGNLPPHVFIAKEKSDLVFELKPGETVVLTGRPIVGKKLGMTQIVFLADTIARPLPPSRSITPSKGKQK
jgi:hypothetical protein